MNWQLETLKSGEAMFRIYCTKEESKMKKKSFVGSISFYPIRVQSSPLEHGKCTWF